MPSARKTVISSQAARRCSRKHTWYARAYWACLLLTVGVPLLLGTVNSYNESAFATRQWISPLIVIGCLAALLTGGFVWVRAQGLAHIVRRVRGRVANNARAASLLARVHRLSSALGLTPPRLYLMEHCGAGVFSFSRSKTHSAIFVDANAVGALAPAELDAVLCHELQHIKHCDGRSRTWLICTAGFVVLMAYGFVQMILHGSQGKKRDVLFRFLMLALFFVVLPFLIPWVWACGVLIKRIAAEQEYRADVETVALTQNARALMSAVVKLTDYGKDWWHSPDTFLYMLYIIAPSLDENPLERLFNVHPQLADRLKRLCELAKDDTSEEGRSLVTQCENLIVRDPKTKRRENLWIVVILGVCLLLDVFIVWAGASSDRSGSEDDWIKGEVVPVHDAIVSVDFGSERIESRGLQVKLRGGEYSDEGRCWRLVRPGFSVIVMEFVQETDISRTQMVLAHLSSSSSHARGGGYAPVTVQINGTTLVKGYDAAEHNGGSHGFVVDVWETEPFLGPGKNTIVLRYDGNAETHYWIKRLEVRPSDTANDSE